MVKNTNYEVPHYVMFFILLSNIHTRLKIFSPPCLQISSVYVHSSWRQADFHTYTKQMRCALHRGFGVYNGQQNADIPFILAVCESYFPGQTFHC